MVFSVAQSSLALNSVMAVGALTGMGLLRELSTLLAQPVSDEAVDSFRQDLASHAPQIRAAQDAGILTGSMRRLLGVIEEGETLSATERGEMAQAFTGALTLLGQVPLRKSFRAELERPVSQVLWDSEASFQKIFEEGPLGMSIVGRRLDFHAANAQLIQLLGYDVETLKTKTALDIIHPDFHR